MGLPERNDTMQCCTNETVVRLRKWIGCLTGAVVVLSATALGGCTSRITYLADGSRGYAVSCGGFTQSWVTCLKRAGRLCRSNGYVVGYESEIDRQLVVRCKTLK